MEIKMVRIYGSTKKNGKNKKTNECKIKTSENGNQMNKIKFYR